MKVNVVDSIMGSGKTSAMINKINEDMVLSGKDAKFMYITPYLDEVDRIIESCPDASFKQPLALKGSKVNGIKNLLIHNQNIVSTHSLFHLFDDEIFDLIRTKGYTLIMDEVTEVVEPYSGISKSDIKIIFDEHICHINEDGYIIWDRNDYESGRFSEFKQLCDINALQMFGNTVVMWLFPIKSFEAFEDIYVLTYMFNGQVQKWYYDFYGVEYEWYKATNKDGKYIIEKGMDDSRIRKSLINICDHKINNIGDRDIALSKGWYDRAAVNGMINDLKKNIINYFYAIVKAKSGDIIWTTFKEHEKKLKGNGYTKSFISLNLRASNKYRDRTSCAYLVNRYCNPVIKQFFDGKGIKIDEDAYALSEMLQWIWRSAIRDGKPINIYIPSKRMRTLLIDWLER